MHRRLVQKALQRGQHTRCREGYSRGAPTVSPLRGEHFERTQDIVEIIQRLTHTHIDHIGQSVAFGQRGDLIQDFECRERVVQTLTRSHTETAAHTAPRLRRNAQRSTLTIRDICRLNVATRSFGRIEIFSCSVLRRADRQRGRQTDIVTLSQPRTCRRRQIGHRGDIRNVALVKPACHLPRSKSRQPVLLGHQTQLGKCFSV